MKTLLSDLDLGLGPYARLLAWLMVVLVVSSVGFYLIELRPAGVNDFFSAIWWTAVTMTTVGYGDFVPQTTHGRILGVLVMVSGIFFVSTFTGNLASLMIERQARKRKGLVSVKLHNHIIIIGWNGFGETLVSSLRKSGVLEKNHLVLVNRLDADKREELAYKLELGEQLHYVVGDPTQETVMRRARPAEAKAVYLLAETGLSAAEADQRSIYSALTVRSIAEKTPMYGQVDSPEHREHLMRAGVNEIIVEGELVSHLFGLMGTHPSYWQFFQSLMGLNGHSSLGFRPLSQAEKRRQWKEIVSTDRSKNGSLPIALCSFAKDMTLEDVLDQGAALDNFILELFQRSGQSADLGEKRSDVVVNPLDEQSLEGYDAVIYLKAAGAQ